MLPGHRQLEQALRQLVTQAEDTLDPEFVRATRICDAAAALDGALTFLPEPNLSASGWDAAWQRWLGGTFAKVIAPALLAVAGHAQAGQFRETSAVDQSLTGLLDPQTAYRSSTAGRNMFKRLSGARGARWLDRLQAAAESGATPGHFAVAYACQGALFHLAPRLILATYTYWEWSAAIIVCRQPKNGAAAAFQAASVTGLRRITEELLTSLTTHANATSRASLP